MYNLVAFRQTVSKEPLNWCPGDIYVIATGTGYYGGLLPVLKYEYYNR